MNSINKTLCLFFILCSPASVLAWESPAKCTVTLSAEKINVCPNEMIHLSGHGSPTEGICSWSGVQTSYGVGGCQAKFQSSVIGDKYISVGFSAENETYRSCSDRAKIVVHEATAEVCELGYFLELDEEETEEDCDGAGNPISPKNGNKYLTETDYKGDAGFSINFERSYNSKYAPYSQIGKHWQHNYFRKLSPVQSDPIKDYENADVANKSQRYLTKEEACTGGWADLSLKAGPIPGSIAVPVLEAGHCKIYVDDKYWRTINMYATNDVGENNSVIGWEMHRPGGSTQKFEGTTGILNKSPKIKENFDVTASGFRYIDQNDNIETYDQSGNLVSIENKNGSIQTLAYNPQDFLESITSNRGESLTFTYNAINQIETITDHTSRVWIYLYDGDTNLISVENPDGTKRQYHYNEVDLTSGAYLRHALTGITDENENRYATYEYDVYGRGIATSHAGDVERVDIAYNLDGTRTVTNSLGVVSTYTYQTQNGTSLLKSVAGPGCSTCGSADTSYDYDRSNNRLISKTEKGITTKRGGYDSKGNLGYKIEAFETTEERRTDYTYDLRFSNKVATISEPSIYLDDENARKVTTYTYDDNANITSILVDAFKFDGTPISRATSFQYNGPFNQITQIDGPRIDVADITTLVYYDDDEIEGDNRARLKQVIDARGAIVRDNIQYSATGKVLSESRLNGISVAYTYYPGNDYLETQIETAGSESRATHFTYRPTAEVETITRGYGSVDATTITYSYDEARRLRGITDDLGNNVEYVLDTEGNGIATHVTNASETLIRTQSSIFDDYNRVSDIVGALNQTTHYDYDTQGNLETVTDPLEAVTTSLYDALGRIKETTDPLSGITAYTYDNASNLETVTDPRGIVTSYQYDGLGNLRQQDSPDTGITQYIGYDDAGNLKTKTDAKGQTTLYEYDTLNRLTLITYHDASTTVYAYDIGVNADGRLASITTPDSVVSYEYSPFGQVTNKTQVIGALELSLGYHYNFIGQLDQITYPSGKVIDYSYSNSLATQVTVDGQMLLNNISHDPFGPVTAWTWGAGSHGVSRPHDLDGRLTSYSLAEQTQKIIYTRNGNIDAIQAVGDAANDRDYGYDVLSRLTYFNGLGETHNYSYDANGNRTAQVIDGTAYGYTVADTSNRLQKTLGPTAKNYLYDEPLAKLPTTNR